MKNLLINDLKNIMKPLILYISVLAIVSIFIDEYFAIMIIMLGIIRCCRVACEEDFIQNVQTLYMTFPKKKRYYMIEKNLFFNVISAIFIFVWCVCVYIVNDSIVGLTSDKLLYLQIIIYILIITSLYNFSWLMMFSRYNNILAAKSKLSRFYLIIAALFIISSKNSEIRKYLNNLFLPKYSIFIISFVILTFIIFFSFIFSIHFYERKDIK